ncbi:terminase [Komagataeibacter xylinus]|uniref:Terminase n=1 Tax=Komagataeibacter xylinus TaxID=28448 RepID=A0A318PMR9_KOMXY|nr:terminase gpA endonuclease subunit [Komagataeibacter xylinus]PYD57396.1 terminase [Komagataeibacter xylinus]GBQ80704.1 bacteriophage terminase large subunit [Komagataeibacter xylinus NBRC 15237]
MMTDPNLISLDKVRFVDPRTIISNAIAAFLPPEQIDVADYAALHRYLDNRGGGYVGRWNHDEAPYLVGPMRMLTSRNHLTVAVVGPARSGKTAIGQNWMCQSIDADPADMLVYSATDAMIEEYVKAEINPLIDSHKRLKDKQGKLPRDNSMHFKKFSGMWVQFLAASYRNLIQKSAPRIIITELDACDGNTYELASVRRQSFMYESMVLAESHPDMAAGAEPEKWTAGVMSLYRDSDRHIWYWPCPNCNAYSAPNPMGERVMTLDWPQDAPLDEIKEATRLVCPSCGSLIEDKWRRAMNRDGVWVGAGQSINEAGDISGELIAKETAGFWITGVMSPFVIGGIGSLAYEMAKARRAVENGEEDAVKKLKDVTVKRWGLPFEPPKAVGNLDAKALADRAEPGLRLGYVPEGTRFITAAVDIQGNRFEILVRAWGVGGESWIIDYRKVTADPATSPGDWDDMLKSLEDALYPLTDGSGRAMKIMAIGFDSGGQEGVTLQTYDAWRRARKRRTARKYGSIDGRHAWSILPLKGNGSVNAPLLNLTYPESKRRDRTAGARGEVPVGLFNPNAFKDAASTQMQVAEPGPWCVHFPAALRAAEPPHPFFDQLVAEQRSSDGRWAKVSPNARNEALDLMTMTNVMAFLFGLPRMPWESPPGWAAPWDVNTLVVSMEEETAARNATALATGIKAVAQVVTSEPSTASREERRKRLASQLAR